MLFSVEQAFVGRDEKRAPRKTPAWEASVDKALTDSCWKRFQIIKRHLSNRFLGRKELKKKKKDKEIIVTWDEMRGRKTKQEHEQLLWNK